jgi:hypothetical protein
MLRTSSLSSTSIVRCERCGHESDIQFRYCAMCGVKLPLEAPSSPPAGISKKLDRPAIEEQVSSVNGEARHEVSEPFLLAPDDINARLAYLLEDDLPESHWGRPLVLLLMLIGISVAGWHWHEQLRTYVASHLTQHPNNQAEQVGTAESPGSETGAGTPNNTGANDKPMTAVGDLSVTTAQNSGAVGVEPHSIVPAGAQNAALIQNAATGPAAQDDAAPASSAPSAPSPSNPQLATAAPIATAAPAPDPSEPTGGAVQAAGQDVANAKQEAPASASATKKSPPHVEQAAGALTDAGQLEAQGEKYLNGTGVPTNCNLARRDLQAAAAHGSVKAKRVLGTMYAAGHCVGRDLPLAYRWFAKALRQDTTNDGLSQDLQVLWTQMTVEERQIAIRR